MENSREFQQIINFYDYPLTVSVRHSQDPHVRFGQMTGGTYSLDLSPGSQIAAGLILLVFAVAMLAMSLYKTYRFCIKYTLKDYLTERRRRRYYESG